MARARHHAGGRAGIVPPPPLSTAILGQAPHLTVYLGNSHALHVDLVHCEWDAAVSAPQRKSVTSNQLDYPAFSSDLPPIPADDCGSSSLGQCEFSAVVEEQRDVGVRMVSGGVAGVPEEARRPRKQVCTCRRNCEIASCWVVQTGGRRLVDCAHYCGVQRAGYGLIRVSPYTPALEEDFAETAASGARRTRRTHVAFRACDTNTRWSSRTLWALWALWADCSLRASNALWTLGANCAC